MMKLSFELKAGLAGALLIHYLLFAGMSFIQVPRYQVTVSPSSLEVSLVASRPPDADAKQAGLSRPRPFSLSAEKGRLKPRNRSSVRDISEERFPNPLRGAFSPAKPQSFQNQPPRYPRLARQRGYEGTVLLRVLITPQGRVATLEVIRSSGYAILDRSVLKAVRQWKFTPAKRFGRPVSGSLEIPVEFRLRG